MKEKRINAKMISKITSQITEYYIENGAKNFHIKIDRIDSEYIIYTFGYTELSPKKVEEIKKAMSIHNDMEYGEYWELIGEGEDTDELILIARVCDSVDMNYENKIFELTLKKKF